MSKLPFEKVRSLIERRKLFEQLIRAGGEIVCKGEDSLFKLKPTQIQTGTSLQAEIEAIDVAPQEDLSAIGNFAIEADRYFFSGPLKIRGTQAELPLNCDVFRLQRRATLRITLSPQMGLFIAMTEFQERPVYVTVMVADISAGGARIYFGDLSSQGQQKDPGLKSGSRFKAVIHPPSTRNIDVLCEVKHLHQSVLNQEAVTQYGIEFIEQTQAQKNRLIALTMDLQRKLVLQSE